MVIDYGVTCDLVYPAPGVVRRLMVSEMLVDREEDLPVEVLCVGGVRHLPTQELLKLAAEFVPERLRRHRY